MKDPKIGYPGMVPIARNPERIAIFETQTDGASMFVNYNGSCRPNQSAALAS